MYGWLSSSDSQIGAAFVEMDASVDIHPPIGGAASNLFFWRMAKHLRDLACVRRGKHTPGPEDAANGVVAPAALAFPEDFVREVSAFDGLDKDAVDPVRENPCDVVACADPPAFQEMLSHLAAYAGMDEEIPLPRMGPSHLPCEHVALEHATEVAPVRDVGHGIVFLQESKLVIPEQPDDCPAGSGRLELQFLEQFVHAHRVRSAVDDVACLYNDGIPPDPSVLIAQGSRVSKYLP